MLNLTNKNAFTLAEVLITMTVIGVIASMTIPSLMTDIEYSSYKASAKKVYKELDQAIDLMQIDNGGAVWDLSGTDTTTKGSRMRDAFAEYVVTNKVGLSKDLFGYNIYSYNKKSQYWNEHYTRASLTTNTGVSMMFLSATTSDDECDATINDFTATGSNKEWVCGWIVADTNMAKGPNMLGKDVLFFWILELEGHKYKIYPIGAFEDEGDFLCNETTVSSYSGSGDSGQGCTANLVYDKDMPSNN